MKPHISLFNNIIGPVSAGPSSGSTCAPNRIAYWLQELLDEPVREAIVEFPSNSGFRAHYVGMGTDKGIANGLLGRLPDDSRFQEALSDCAAAGIHLEFRMQDKEAPDESFFNLSLEGLSGDRIYAVVESTGGGGIMIWEIDDFVVEITGHCYDLFLYTEGLLPQQIEELTKTVSARIGAVNIIKEVENGRKVLLLVESPVRPSEALLAELERSPLVKKVRMASPVHAVVFDARLPAPPFHNGATLLDFLEKHPMPLWEAAIVYEQSVSGWSREQVLDRAEHLVEIMHQSVQRGLRGGFFIPPGVMEANAGKMLHNVLTGQTRKIPMGAMDRCIYWALAAMEDSNANGLVVCIPTGGSTGIAPATILGVGEEMGYDRSEQVRALLITGLVGMLMAEGNAFCGGNGGCMQEIGCASSMCAGGVSYYLGATPRQTLAAAAMAMSNSLGMICDPVGNLVQIPCISRNLSAVGNAIICANVVVSGFDPVIPFDETVKAMLEVSAAMPMQFKGCGGGLCNTPTAICICKKVGAGAERGT